MKKYLYLFNNIKALCFLAVFFSVTNFNVFVVSFEYQTRFIENKGKSELLDFFVESAQQDKLISVVEENLLFKKFNPKILDSKILEPMYVLLCLSMVVFFLFWTWNKHLQMDLKNIKKQLKEKTEELEKSKADLQLTYKNLDDRMTERTEQLYNLEKEQRRIAERFQFIIDSVDDFVVFINSDHKIEVVNQYTRNYVSKLYGKDIEVGNSYSEFMHKDEVKYWQKNLNYVFVGNISEFEVKTVRNDFLWFKLYPVYFEGKISGAALFSRNLNDQKQLDVYRKRYEQLISASPDTVSMVDRKYRCIIVNESYSAFFNKSIDQIIGKTVSDIIGEDFFKKDSKKFIDRAFLGEIVQVEQQIFLPNLGTHYFIASYAPVYDENNNVEYVSIYGKEITKFKSLSSRFNLAKSMGAFGFWEWYPDTGEIKIDERILDMYKLSAPLNNIVEIFDFWKLVLSEEELAKRKIEIEEVLEGEKKEIESTAMVTLSDDSVKYIFSKILAEKGENGKTHIVGSALDVTKLQTMEVELKKTMVELNSILDNAGVGIALVKDWVYTRVNKKLIQICGYSKEELEGMPASTFYASQEDYDNFALKAYEQISQGKTFVREEKMPRKDGSSLWVRITGQAIDVGNPEEGSVWIFEDISEKKNYDILVKESEALYRALFEDNSVVSLLIDPNTTNIEQANDAALSYYGWSRENLVGMSMSKLTNIDSDQIKVLLNEIYFERIKNFEHQNIRADGELRDVNVHAGHIVVNNKDLIFAYINDITETKTTQKALIKAKEDAELANKSKSLFLANMSHEIRTPMNAILGITQLLLDSELNSTQYDYLDRMYKSSKSLLGIINSILDYSKIEASKLVLESIEFEFTEILDSISKLFSYSIEEKGLELFFDVAPNIPILLVGDPLRLNQILNNLVGNAIKFTSKGKIGVIITCPKKEKDKVILKFDVKDTGLGMSKEEIELLFKPFDQVDTSIARKYGGTGLGLSISKQLTEMMGGTISVASEKNKGSTFTVTIPFKIRKKSVLGSTLQNLQESVDQFELEELDQEKIGAIIQNIFDAVCRSYFVSPESTNKLYAYLLNSGMETFANELKNSLDAFDYKKAKQMLKRIAKKIKLKLFNSEKK